MFDDKTFPQYCAACGSKLKFRYENFSLLEPEKLWEVWACPKIYSFIRLFFIWDKTPHTSYSRLLPDTLNTAKRNKYNNYDIYTGKHLD